MLNILREETDPYFNLAAEEYFLHELESDAFMIWQNSDSIIVGKHQNAMAEVNMDFAREHNIPVIRRISGGGTVFHDLGNVNFSFIRAGKPGEKLVDFRRFTNPLIAALNALGVPAGFEGKNNIRAGGLKISGNSEHVYKNKVLHHGTLLFDTDLDKLEKAIAVERNRFTDKAILSLRTTVCNIRELLDTALSVTDFIQYLNEFISGLFPETIPYVPDNRDKENIIRLADQKYHLWSWNFAYSPPYSLKNSLLTEKGLALLELRVENGHISEISVDAIHDIKEDLEVITHLLKGQKHEALSLSDSLIPYQQLFDKISLDKDIFIRSLF